jgi:hypothetical protein
MIVHLLGSTTSAGLWNILLRRTVEPVFGVGLDARCGSLADHISFEDPIHVPQRDCGWNDWSILAHGVIVDWST